MFLKGGLALPNGEWLTLLDYQFPLKSVRADEGIGKVDLLGLFEDGTLAVVELKLEQNQEDRRIALIESLIYSAVVEANVETIADEVQAARGCRVAAICPRIVLIAAPPYWSDTRTFPPTEDIQQLATEIAGAIPIEINLMRLIDAELVELGLNGRTPRLRGHAYLSSVSDEPWPAIAVRSRNQGVYLQNLSRTQWAYQRAAFTPEDDVFDPRYAEGSNPPVFQPQHAARNVLAPPASSPVVIASVVNAVAPEDRHRWFRSMRSSQALAQSVFGSLAAMARLDALEGLAAEDGHPAFFDSVAGFQLTLEHQIDSLGEPRPTSVDAFFNGPKRVAVEVKLTEAEFGACSRPALRPADFNFARDHCDGTFTIQRNRATRCSLSDRGVGYWRFAPRVFGWPDDQDHRPCPLNSTYQLVRTVLAACVADGGILDVEGGHALVIYDARNPAFCRGGAADAQWWATVRALRYPRLLRRVSWQRLAAHFGQVSDLSWLTRALDDKYGIRDDGARR